MVIPGVWKVYPTKELSVAVACAVLGHGTSSLINKLRHDHPGPLIPVCVRLERSNPAAHAQPWTHRACKLYTSGLPRQQAPLFAFSISRLFYAAIPCSRDVRIDPAFGPLSFIERSRGWLTIRTQICDSARKRIGIRLRFYGGFFRYGIMCTRLQNDIIPFEKHLMF